MTPLRCVVVDDHPVVRAGLMAVLSGRPGIEVVGEAADGRTALQVCAELRPDAVLCDLRLGTGPDGVDVTRALTGVPEPPAVVILTTFDHDADIVRAVEAGAAGYLLKDAPPDEIVEALERAARGETVLRADQTARVVRTMQEQRRATLSERELDVLRLVAEGRGNKEIARALFVSEATVKTHLNHVFGKLDVTSRTAAVAAARRTGVLD
ncbi:response regulator transcription factor [Ammonicoccus fulvus]|uniref:Response regulator transcription factor n=1 Tax=Ammonicoccus fulvus TaxID=3138240 RepID=A0ABZ3FRF7_9ACTN